MVCVLNTGQINGVIFCWFLTNMIFDKSDDKLNGADIANRLQGSAPNNFAANVILTEN